MLRRVLVVYGSQTGQAKAISEQIYERCSHELNCAENGLFLANYSLDLVGRRFAIECEQLVVFVVSTTGEGEPPTNARKLWRRISKRTLPPSYLSNLNYALLGLGDSNYNRFANFGRDLDRRLQELGAKHFYETGFGDDAVGIEVGVEPWIYGLIPQLLHHLGLYDVKPIPKVIVNAMTSESVNESSLMQSTRPLSELIELSLPLVTKKLNEISIEKIGKYEDGHSNNFFFAKTPVMESSLFEAKIISLKCLTSKPEGLDIGEKIVLEAEIESNCVDFPNFVAGDSFGFICGNYDEEVEQIMQILDCSDTADDIYSIKCESIKHLPEFCSLRDYFKYYCELRTVPTKSCIRCFSDYCSNESHKRRMLELSSREGLDDYAKYVRGQNLSVLDLLQTFGSCKPTMEAFFANVPCFVPRYYSVVNTQNEQKKSSFRIAFAVVELDKICHRNGTQLRGVFTGLMHSLFQKSQEKVNQQSPIATFKAFKRKNPFFKLPNPPNVPLILIAAGTGLTPFIGFLEERQKFRESGEELADCWLLYGCRHSKQDFIYEEELFNFHSEKVITNLCVSFSRENNSPKYVHHLVEENGHDLNEIIKNEKSMVYVCGDLKKLSTNVNNSFVNIIEEFQNLNREDAVKIVRDLQSNKRYLQDLWI